MDREGYSEEPVLDDRPRIEIEGRLTKTPRLDAPDQDNHPNEVEHYESSDHHSHAVDSSQSHSPCNLSDIGHNPPRSDLPDQLVLAISWQNLHDHEHELPSKNHMPDQEGFPIAARMPRC